MAIICHTDEQSRGENKALPPEKLAFDFFVSHEFATQYFVLQARLKNARVKSRALPSARKGRNP